MVAAFPGYVVGAGSVLDRVIDGHPVGQRRSDGYVNATALCKAAGKKFNDYVRNQTTQEFLEEMSRSAGIPADLLVDSRVNGPNELRGTWVHPDVAINLAQWCSPRFAVQVSRWVRELLTTGRVELATPRAEAVVLANDPVIGMLDVIRTIRLGQIAAEKAAEEAKAMAHAALCQGQNAHGFYQVLGFARLHGWEVSEAQASRVGRAASVICRERGVERQERRHERYGVVYSYPESVLVDAFRRTLGYDVGA